MSTPNSFSVEQIHCNSGSELLAKLEELSSAAGPPEYRSSWVFRGHCDSGWDLKPSAWRKDGRAKLTSLRDYLEPLVWNRVTERYSQATEESRAKKSHGTALSVATEIIAVKQFCNLADELGMVIPDADSVLDEIDAIHLVVSGYVPLPHRPGAQAIPLGRPQAFIDIPFAIAQHHGIPTRYLDWTRDPKVAAFFAVDDPCIDTNKRVESTVCVWATRCDRSTDHIVRWVTVPRGQHHYLHAQHGLFSVPVYDENQNGSRPSFVETLERASQDVPVELKQFVLPLQKTPELREHLFKNRFSKAHLMPTFDNVAAVTRQRWGWYPPLPLPKPPF